MSYILNALRKSEAQRRLGESPDLSTAVPGPPPKRPGRRRFPLLLLLVLGAGLTVVAAVWISDRPLPWLAGPGPEASESIALETPDEPSDPIPESAAAETLAVEDSEPAAPPAESAVTPVIDRRSPAQQPATVVSRPAPQRSVDVPRPPAERERLVESAEEAQRLIDEARAAAPTAPQEARIPEPSVSPSERESPSTEPWAPERAEFVRKWELPLAVRRDLPSLSLSIHVFSIEPAARFVLINGERRVEGDDLGQGASLVEIRREGALVQFRDYRFLLEP